MIDKYGWYGRLPEFVRSVTDPLIASEYERAGYYQLKTLIQSAGGREVGREEIFTKEAQSVPFLLAQIACSLAYLSGSPEALARIVYGPEALRSQLDPKEWGFDHISPKGEVVFRQAFPLRGKRGSNPEVTARAIGRLTERFRVLLAKHNQSEDLPSQVDLLLQEEEGPAHYMYRLQIIDRGGKLRQEYEEDAKRYLGDLIASQLYVGLREADQSNPVVLMPDHEHEGFFASPAMLLYGKHMLGEFLAKWSPELVQIVDEVSERFKRGEIRGIEHFELPLRMGNYTREVKFELKPSRDAEGVIRPLLTCWGVDLPRGEDHEEGQNSRQDFEEILRQMPIEPPL